MKENKKILIIDDEEDFCYFMKKDLEMVGDFDVSVCSDSTKSIEMARAIHPDLILLDIMMPKMDGLKIVSILRSSKDTRNIPVVYLSAFTTENNKDLYHLSKPINIDDLLFVINKLT